MIISPSHTLEYKPNDIIITSSIGDVLLHHPNIIETNVILTSRSQAPPPKIREVEPRWHFCGYLPHRRYVMPSRLPPRDCVVYPSERSNARLSAALRDHPGSRLPRRGIDLEFYVVQDATSKYRTRYFRGFILCSF